MPWLQIRHWFLEGHEERTFATHMASSYFPGRCRGGNQGSGPRKWEVAGPTSRPPVLPLRTEASEGAGSHQELHPGGRQAGHQPQELGERGSGLSCGPAKPMCARGSGLMSPASRRVPWWTTEPCLELDEWAWGERKRPKGGDGPALGRLPASPPLTP